MKNKLDIFLVISIFSILALVRPTLAQQGVLDTSFGNGTGIFQETLPAPTPQGATEGYIHSAFGTGDAYADGSVIIAGQLGSSTSNNSYFDDILLRRLLPNGTVDTAFGTNGYVQTVFSKYGTGFGQQTSVSGVTVKIQPQDGKIVVVAQCSNNNNVAPNQVGLGNDVCLVRYNQNGSLDASFGGNIIVAQYGSATTTYTMDAGKVFTITGTNSYHPNIVSGMDGVPYDLKIGADGRIYVFGTGRDDLPIPGSQEGVSRPKGFVAVYSTSGALQNIYSFYDETGSVSDGGGFGSVKIFGGEVLSNGNFVAAGQKQHRTDGTNYTAAKWTIWTNDTPNGIYIDNGNGHANERALTVKLLRSNKILVGGAYGSTSPYSDNQAALVRYNSDLTRDATFGSGGIVVYDNTYREPNHIYMRGFAAAYITDIQTDGKILLTDALNGGVWRFNPNGSPDYSFGIGRNDPRYDYNFGFIANGDYISPFPIKDGRTVGFNFGYPFLKPNGRIVTAGCIACGFDGATLPRGIVSQLTSYPRNGGIFNDFDNDGKAELAVYRPTEGNWYQSRSFNNNFNAVQFGSQNDKLAPADYDGDGRTDRAVYRNGVWIILQSSNNQVRYVNFGLAGDLPRPGDFNGDGYADIAVFRPSNGYWYILYSNPLQPGNVTFSAVQFGQSGDAPMLEDFDGDGKTDICVWRPSSGLWFWIRSADNQVQAAQFGTNGDVPINGDFNADGKSDLAVFRPSSGTWFIARSQSGAPAQNFDSIQFGLSSDTPVAADYDNDGKTDVAVYRAGDWFILKSADNSFSATNFGLANDKPIQAAYLP